MIAELPNCGTAELTPLQAPSPEGGGAQRVQFGNSALQFGSRRCRCQGFTLIELMIVISIILILMSAAIPMYQQSIVRARESVLREDLYTMRQAIDNFTMDKQRAPQSLDELVQAGYLRTIPKDPITNATDTWQVVNEDVMMSVDQTQPGITDVHSGSNLTGTDGTAYSSW
jgi:general secretion pathway protein G